MAVDTAPLHDIQVGEHDLISTLRPDSIIGALVYLLLFVLMAALLARMLRVAVHAAMTRQGHVDRTTMSFLQQFGSAFIWVIMFILYAHLIPPLRAMGTALLAGASVASIVLGLAAQSTLGNLVAGISITIYKPFRLGDTLQLATPTGTEIGVVEAISLGYTTLRTPDGRYVVLPNALAASQVVLNLSTTFAPWQMSIVIRMSRDADLEAARHAALEVAEQTVGKSGVKSCYLNRVDGDLAELELRYQVPDAASRQPMRANLIAKLSQRFDELQVAGSAHPRASFS
jgi:small-conductance mechanosensitive channel